LAIGDRLFLSASYNTGAALLRISGDGYAKIWSRIGALDAHYNTPVHVAGFLYGVDGRQEEGARLRCLDLATGQPRWTVDRYGCASIIVADAKLWLVGEKGTLELAEADPRAFRSRGKQTILDGVVRAHPALANGRLYARSAGELACLDLREKQ
jgi:outer membrane protein assembly factor BamB